MQIFALEMPPFTRGKFTFVHGCSVGILTGVFCLGDFRRLTHIDAHQRRLYFGGGLPSQCVNKLARHEKNENIYIFFNGCKFYFGCMNCMNSTCVLQLSPKESNAGLLSLRLVKNEIEKRILKIEGFVRRTLRVKVSNGQIILASF